MCNAHNKKRLRWTSLFFVILNCFKHFLFNISNLVNFKDEEVTVLSDNNGNSVNVIEYDGYYLSKKAIEKGRIPDPRSNIPNIIKMEIRPDDVFLVAYPKAGK